jgi:hypothetical protein
LLLARILRAFKTQPGMWVLQTFVEFILYQESIPQLYPHSIYRDHLWNNTQGIVEMFASGEKIRINTEREREREKIFLV